MLYAALAVAGLISLLTLFAGGRQADCLEAAKLSAPGQGDSVGGPFTLKLELADARCVSVVTYLMDGVEIGSEVVPPFELTVDPATLPPLPAQEQHVLSVKVEQVAGEFVGLPDKRTIKFITRNEPAQVKEDPPPPPPGAAQGSPAPGAKGGPGASNVGELCRLLAYQISRKSGYAFDQKFLALVESELANYKGVNPSAAIRPYKADINKAFMGVGLEPFLGYILGFSRSKFESEGGHGKADFWRIPPEALRPSGYLGPNEEVEVMGDPRRSSEVAAVYTKALLTTFDQEDFMLALACYGMSINDVGKFKGRLETGLTDQRARRDVIKLREAGLLSDAQVSQLAKFFAAGIVGENPKEFGLKGAEPFSTLY